MSILHKISAACLLPMLLTACISESSDQHISEIVEKTLNEKPEIIIDALNNYRQREESKKIEQQKIVLESQSEKLQNDGYSLVLGNPKGDVTLVAFKDYRCGYCKKAWPTIHNLIKEDAQLRVVFKEFPVLGPDSERAAKYALASGQQSQDKYKAYNDALMKHRGPWDAKTLREIAKSKAIDVQKLTQDLSSKAVTDAIAKNREIAQQLSIGGTPAFIVGLQLIPGAVPENYLKDAIKMAREARQSDPNLSK